MTWDWFVPMQQRNYPNVSFPGNRYHVNFHGAFTMKQFLDANIRAHPIFLCGPWKEGDHSNLKNIATGASQQGHSTTEWIIGQRVRAAHSDCLMCASCARRVLRGLPLGRVRPATACQQTSD